jgi:hypothetical protein
MKTLKNPRLADLSERRYRIVLEESWQHERPEIRNPDRIWYEQIFDGEAVIYFPSEAVHIVAELATARRKRRLSEAHKAKLAEANQAYRFKPKFDASEIAKTPQI